MHEYSLYGTVSASRHGRIIQQLAGYTCMQPQDFTQIHLLFKSRPPTGAAKVQQGTGNSQAVSQVQQEAQKLRAMLQSGIYYVKVIGELSPQGKDNQEAGMNWMFEFKDTPQAGNVKTINRLIQRIKFEAGNHLAFLNLLGFDYVSRYCLQGQRFYTNNTTLSMYRVYNMKPPSQGQAVFDYPTVPSAAELELIDTSGGFIIEASIETTDVKADLRERVEKQLLSVQADLSTMLNLSMPDRLTFDTRVPVQR